jgi:hypothetical protein
MGFETPSTPATPITSSSLSSSQLGVPKQESLVTIYWGRAVSCLVRMQTSNSTVKTICRVASILFPASFVGMLLTLAIRRAELLKQPTTIGLMTLLGLAEGMVVKCIADSQKQIAVKLQVESQQQKALDYQEVAQQIKDILGEEFEKLSTITLSVEGLSGIKPEHMLQNIMRGDIEGQPFVACLVQSKEPVGNSEVWIFHADESSWKIMENKMTTQKETITSSVIITPVYVSRYLPIEQQAIPKVLRDLKEGTHLTYKLAV